MIRVAASNGHEAEIGGTRVWNLKLFPKDVSAVPVPVGVNFHLEKIAIPEFFNQSAVVVVSAGREETNHDHAGDPVDETQALTPNRARQLLGLPDTLLFDAVAMNRSGTAERIVRLV